MIFGKFRCPELPEEMNSALSTLMQNRSEAAPVGLRNVSSARNEWPVELKTR